MPRNPFTLKFDKLPAMIPVFPLPNAVVMPGTQLPLNIFEPRYLNMVFDVLGSHRMIGMVQPDPATSKSSPEALYSTGCAGRITSFSETSDGRLLIVLTGVCRFDIGKELPTTRGYRSVLADWGRFKGDYAPEVQKLFDRERLLEVLRIYCEFSNVEVSWDDLTQIGDDELVNLLATQLPLSATERQALIEAVDAAQRAELLYGLMTMATAPGTDIVTRKH